MFLRLLSIEEVFTGYYLGNKWMGIAFRGEKYFLGIVMKENEFSLVFVFTQLLT